jgi:shikimate kinase
MLLKKGDGGRRMKRIYLTGFMGAGKTSVGERLSQYLQLPMIDTDQYIEKQVGKPIKQIFAENGEETFRNYESMWLRRLPNNIPIVTTGGGIVMRKENRDWMKQTGTVIYLHCEWDELLRRLAGDDTRPLLSSLRLDELKLLWEKRLPYYQEADMIVNTTNRTVEQIAKEIANRIKVEKEWRS